MGEGKNNCTKMKYAMFIGRFQIFNAGHRWLIEQKLKMNTPVLLCIRNVEPDINNPFSASEVFHMLNDIFQKEIANEMLKVIIIPDIESVNYGRDVGYNVVEHSPPDSIKIISATEIRNKLNNNDDSWKDYLDPVSIKWIKKNYKKIKK